MGKVLIGVIFLAVSLSSLHAKPSSIKDMADGYVRGGATWFHIKDEYTELKGGAAGEYERTELWEQMKLVAQGRAIYLNPDYYRVVDITTFPGKGEDGSTKGQLLQDKGKYYWLITLESRDENKKMVTRQGASELTLVKGTWDDFEKGLDVELQASEADTQGNGKQVKGYLDIAWNMFRDKLLEGCPTCTFGKVEKLSEGSSTRRIVLKANLKKASFTHPRWTNEYKFTTHKEY